MHDSVGGHDRARGRAAAPREAESTAQHKGGDADGDGGAHRPQPGGAGQRLQLKRGRSGDLLRRLASKIGLRLADFRRRCGRGRGAGFSEFGVDLVDFVEPAVDDIEPGVTRSFSSR